MKKAIKKTVKVKKPKYTIDMRDVDDVTIDFFCQKVENGMELTGSDFATFASIVADSLLEKLMPEEGTALVRDNGVYRMCTAVRVEEKAKKPWYKRLWNWITRKK